MLRPIGPSAAQPPEPGPVPDPRADDPIARAFQVGLMIYLSPVVLLVLIIGGVSVAAQATGQFVFGAIRRPEPASSGPATEDAAEFDLRARRRAHAAR